MVCPPRFSALAALASQIVVNSAAIVRLIPDERRTFRLEHDEICTAIDLTGRAAAEAAYRGPLCAGLAAARSSCRNDGVSPAGGRPEQFCETIRKEIEV